MNRYQKSLSNIRRFVRSAENLKKHRIETDRAGSHLVLPSLGLQAQILTFEKYQKAQTRDLTHLRTGAGAGYVVSRLLPKGRRVIVLKQTGGWLKVRCGHLEGWIHTSQLDLKE